MNTKNIIMITWERHTRNIFISKELNCNLYELLYDNKINVIRYLKSIIVTIKIIIKEKPSYVIAQNPSIILSLGVMLLKNIFKYKTIIDSHNCGIFPFEGKYKIFMFLSKIIQRYADLVIVTNIGLKFIVENNKGNSVILPDKIPDINHLKYEKISNNNNCITYICSFSKDEPYQNFLIAASYIPDVEVYVTGNYINKFRKINDLPPNVKLLGYIPENEYWNMLVNSKLIVDLTYREDCLVCGAYEALAVEKPLVLSNTRALRKYFYKGCVFVDSDINSIKNGIICAISNINKLKIECTELKKELNDHWNIYYNEFINKISHL